MVGLLKVLEELVVVVGGVDVAVGVEEDEGGNWRSRWGEWLR